MIRNPLSSRRRQSLILVLAVGAALGCTAAGVPPAGTRLRSALGIEGAWRLVETAVRAPGGVWDARAATQGGLYVFTSRHYSYFYVRGSGARPRFGDPNRPTQAEMAAAYDSFIAGAGTYTFDGRTLALKADFRKNPNEMNGEIWRLQAEIRGDTLRLVFDNPPFLPGRQWRTTLVRIE